MASPPSVQHAHRLFKEGHSIEAEQMAKEVLTAEQCNVDAMVLLTMVAKARCDHPAIERLAQSALSIRQNDRYLMSLRAENLFQMGNPQQAIDVCDRALSHFPDE